MKNNNYKSSFKADISLYPIESIYGASYVFVDKVYIFLEKDAKGNVIINFKAKPDTTKKDLDKIVGEFQNELLNYTLRHSLSKTNKIIRQRIIERALYSSIGEEEDIWSDEEEVK